MRRGSEDVLPRKFFRPRQKLRGHRNRVIAPAPLLNDEFFLTFTNNTMSVSVPLSLIGSSTGIVNYGVIVGTSLEATDELPNEARFATNAAATNAVPEPSSPGLAACGLVFAIRRYFKSRY